PGRRRRRPARGHPLATLGRAGRRAARRAPADDGHERPGVPHERVAHFGARRRPGPPGALRRDPRAGQVAPVQPRPPRGGRARVLARSRRGRRRGRARSRGVARRALPRGLPRPGRREVHGAHHGVPPGRSSAAGLQARRRDPLRADGAQVLMTATVTETAPAAEIPTFDATLRIRRLTPETHGDEPYWQEFTIQAHGTDRLLDALHKAKWDVDGSLSFRRSCAHGICGSDAMRINGRNRLACKTLLKDLNPDKPITVEPLKGLPVIKDLIVDMEPFFASYREIMPFLVTEGQTPTKERLQSAEQRELFDDTTKC